jgi:hypothetical protein
MRFPIVRFSFSRGPRPCLRSERVYVRFMVNRWRIWIRNRADRPWYDPVIDCDGGHGSWDSREDAEAIAQQFRLRSVAMGGQETAALLGIDGQVAPEDIEVIVLPDGEQPDDAMRILTLPSGEQLPTGRL